MVKWKFEPDGETKGMGFWSFDTAEYSIAIGEWPKGHAYKRDSTAPSAYVILRRETGSTVCRSSKKYKHATAAKRAALSKLHAMLAKSMLAIEKAWR